MQILSQKQILQKIKRIAIEILEKNFDEKELILAGINNRGFDFARMLKIEMESVSDTHIILTSINLSPAAPLEKEIILGMDNEALNGKTIIIVDDVANTGRTIYYAFRPLMNILPKKVEVAVLVDREHKSFPVSSNYVGLSLATTLNENIDVKLDKKEMSVHLN